MGEKVTDIDIEPVDSIEVVEPVDASSLRIGLYGGSFNPIHNGHLLTAKQFVKELKLDKMFLIPSKISPHRSMDEYVPEEHRVEMLNLVSVGEEKIEVCDYELKHDRISKTIYTVGYFRQAYPNAELFLIVGSDMLMTFDTWHGYKDILSMCSLCCMIREDGDMKRITPKAKELSKYGNVFISDIGVYGVSSSKVRKAIKDFWTPNETVETHEVLNTIDKRVLDYIIKNNLYK